MTDLNPHETQPEQHTAEELPPRKLSPELLASVAMLFGLASAIILIYHVLTFPFVRRYSVPLDPVYGYRMFAIVVLWLAHLILALFSITMQPSKLGYIAVAGAGYPVVLCLIVVIGSFIL